MIEFHHPPSLNVEVTSIQMGRSIHFRSWQMSKTEAFA